MTLQEKLLHDLRTTRDKTLKRILRIAVGELQRQPNKELTDDEVIRIIRKLYKSEEELIEAGGYPTDPAFLAILGLYLPGEVTEYQVTEWIISNVDFSSLKNKMQAIGLVTKHFGAAVDGSMVKDIVSTKF